MFSVEKQILDYGSLLQQIDVPPSEIWDYGERAMEDDQKDSE